jgi:hypothetical protein
MVSIKITNGDVKKVVLRHANTRSKERRDFRMVRQSNERTPACKWPDIDGSKLNIDIMGASCFSIMWWHELLLAESDNEPSVYKALPPYDGGDHWTGYFIQVYFEGK